MDWNVFGATFATIFLAEFGGKAQFAAFAVLTMKEAVYEYGTFTFNPKSHSNPLFPPKKALYSLCFNFRNFGSTGCLGFGGSTSVLRAAGFIRDLCVRYPKCMHAFVSL